MLLFFLANIFSTSLRTNLANFFNSLKPVGDAPIKLSLKDNRLFLENATTEYTSPELPVEKKDQKMEIQLNLDEQLNIQQLQTFLLSTCYDKNKILLEEKEVEFFNIDRSEEIFKKLNPSQRVNRVIKIDNDDVLAYFFHCQEDLTDRQPISNIAYFNGQLVETDFLAPLPYYVVFKRNFKNEDLAEALMNSLTEKEIFELNMKMKFLLLKNYDLYKKYLMFSNGKSNIRLDSEKTYYTTTSDHVFNYVDRDDIILLDGVLDEQIVPYLGTSLKPLNLKAKGENATVSQFFDRLFGLKAELSDVNSMTVLARGMISPYLLSMYSSDPHMKSMFAQSAVLCFPPDFDLTKYSSEQLLKKVAKEMILAKIGVPKVLEYLDNEEGYKKAYDACYDEFFGEKKDKKESLPAAVKEDL